MSGNQSTDELYKELEQFCDPLSDSLSEDGLREIIERYGCAPKSSDEKYEFFVFACWNPRVTQAIL